MCCSNNNSGFFMNSMCNYGYPYPSSNYTCYYTPNNMCNNNYSNGFNCGGGCSSLAIIALFALLCR